MNLLSHVNMEILGVYAAVDSAFFVERLSGFRLYVLYCKRPDPDCEDCVGSDQRDPDELLSVDRLAAEYGLGRSTVWLGFGPYATARQRQGTSCLCVAVTAGLPAQFRFYDLRHAAASLLIADGLPITLVSAMLGHALTSTTLNNYAHVLPGTDRFAADAMERLLG